MKILLAVDGSAYSAGAVAEVSRRPWPPQSEVRIITVDLPLDSDLLRGGSPTVFDELAQRQRVEAERHLNAAAATFKQYAPGLRVTPILREGHPKEVILDEAERWGADLIVVGSHGYGAIRRFFLGSVSLAVATNAPCSVEIVRIPRQSAP
jgi:nucleotide-binding universal stress UspA family protein